MYKWKFYKKGDMIERRFDLLAANHFFEKSSGKMFINGYVYKSLEEYIEFIESSD
jgi:hypothetical protein